MKPIKLLAIALSLSLITLALPANLAHADSPSGTWTPTGSLNGARGQHTVTALADGRVLVAGGFRDTAASATAEIYDSHSGTWAPTGAMHQLRADHTATLLADGRVLVVGGNDPYAVPNRDLSLTSAELYDPHTGTWTTTGSLHDGRMLHTATLLSDGKVLVVGGWNTTISDSLYSAELYDPATGTWDYAGNLGYARRHHTSTLLSDGNVLVVGGAGNSAFPANAEIYDHITGAWAITGALHERRLAHSATLLPNGKVLVAGGSSFDYLASAEVFDPSTGEWTVTGSMNGVRESHAAVLLPDGRALVAGASASIDSSPSTSELYDYSTGTWTRTGLMNHAHGGKVIMVLLANGQALITGGWGGGETELFGFASNPQIAPVPAGTGVEGGTYTAAGTFSDASSTSWTGTADYGDGSGLQPLSIDNSAKSFSLSHVYKNDGVYTVHITVTGNLGASGTSTNAVTVSNAPAVISAITGPAAPVSVGTSFAASATFADPGVLDTHTAMWSWGDGTQTPGSLTEHDGSGSVSNSHTYAQAGVYIITVSVTDDGYATSTATYQYLVAYDPSAGFVTVSGKYISQAGWDMQSPSAAGVVRFGGQVKYTNNTLPSSNVKFSFKVGGLDFTSTGCQWLVLSGAKAMFKANGTVNGSGSYTILVSGVDGSTTNSADLVRVKITDDSTNTVIYDTQPGAPETADPMTPLTSGFVKVH